jgi:hypothetical protein
MVTEEKCPHCDKALDRDSKLGYRHARITHAGGVGGLRPPMINRCLAALPGAGAVRRDAAPAAH